MNLYNLFFHLYYIPGYLQYNWSGKCVWMHLATGLAEDNSLGKPLAFSHVFDLRAFAPLYVNHKRKTHRITHLMRTLLQIVVEK